MVIQGNHLIAENGKVLHRIGELEITKSTEVWLSPKDSVSNWEEIEYHETVAQENE